MATFFGRNKAYPPARKYGRRFHELRDCGKYHLKLGVVLLFHRFALAGQVLVGCQDFSESHERTHDNNIDLDGAHC